MILTAKPFWGAEPWCISLALPVSVDYPTVNGRLLVACLVLFVQKLSIAYSCSAMPFVPGLLRGKLAPLSAYKFDWHIYQFVRIHIPWHIHQT